ncbi:hypothetical protein ACFVTZ_16170 [Cellulosimicrobium cellulans]|uniref:hypothetical protein n=1 Tax=Cellulosimicrobium cellulans TaxID=1710 RepID=UPI0036E90E4B
MTHRARRDRLRFAATAVLVLSAGAVAAPAAAADFPIEEPFGSASPNDPAWVPFGEATLTGEGDGWLRLTDVDTTNGGFGGYVLDSPFPTDLGVVVEFEYATWGGQELGGNRGDGFSFFLMDGSFPAAVGGDGGSLGYTFLQGGYAGVGFDEFGNFSAGVGGPGPQPGFVSVRGSYAADTPWGYLTGAPGPGGTVETVPPGGGDPSRAFVRTVRAVVTPAPSTDLLSVWSDSGPGTPLEPLISQFDLGGAAGQPELPATFKLGFGASTGGATNYHEIRNLRVVVPTVLTVEKTTSTPVVESGGQVSYQLEVTNGYVNDVVGARVVDTVPAELTDVTWTCAATGGAACGAASGSGNAIDTTVDLPRLTGPTPTASAVLTVTGTAPFVDAETVLTNTAEVVAPPDREDLTDNASSVDVTVLPAADLAVTKELTSPAPLVLGEPVEYVVDVTNEGPGSARGVVVADALPPALDPASVVADGCTLEGTTLVCPVGPLEAGASASFTITGTVGPDAATCSAGDVVQRARVASTSGDPDPSNDVAEVTTPCVVPVALSVTKTGPAQVTGGESLRWEVVVTNDGPAAAPGTIVQDAVPVAVTGVSWTCSVSDGSACDAPSGTGNDVSTTATVPAGGTATVVVTGTAPPAGGTVTNTATVEPCAACVDDGDGPHEATATTTVTAAPVPGPGPGPGPQQPGTSGPGLATTGVDVVAASAAALVAVALGTGLALHGARARRRT